MKHQKLPLWFGLAVCALVGAAFFWGAWASSQEVRRFLVHAGKATGTITGYRTSVTEVSGEKPKTAWYPQIAWVDGGGQARSFEASLAIDQGEYPVGDRIAILINPDRPGEARLDSFWNLGGDAVILAIFGGLFAGTALLVFFLLIREVEVDTENAVLVAFGVTAALLALLTWGLAGDSLYLSAKGVRTSGVLLAGEGAPLVEYSAPNGLSYRRQSHVSDSETNWRPGDACTILYDPQRPGRARIDDFNDLWFVPCLSGGFGAFFGLLSLWLLVRRLRGSPAKTGGPGRGSGTAPSARR
jgi:hypothetical protein